LGSAVAPAALSYEEGGAAVAPPPPAGAGYSYGPSTY